MRTHSCSQCGRLNHFSDKAGDWVHTDDGTLCCESADIKAVDPEGYVRMVGASS